MKNWFESEGAHGAWEALDGGVQETDRNRLGYGMKALEAVRGLRWPTARKMEGEDAKKLDCGKQGR